jgi:mercuric ion transport protein
MLEDIRKVLGIALAVVTCPCHLPVTAPLLLSLLAGTTLGAYLSTHLEVLAAVSTALFLGGLALAAAGSEGRQGSGRAAAHPTVSGRSQR